MCIPSKPHSVYSVHSAIGRRMKGAGSNKTRSPSILVSLAAVVWACHTTLPPPGGKKKFCVTSPNGGCEGEYVYTEIPIAEYCPKMRP